MLIISCSSQWIYSQNDEIIWEHNNPVTWEDFKDKSRPKDNTVASISTGINFEFTSEYAGNNLIFNYVIYAYMNPRKSWVDTKSKSTYVLKHEQLHFDITALVAFKFKREIESYSPSKQLENDLSKIYNKYIKIRNQLQHQYDSETNHGINTTAQLIWEKKVEALLYEFVK